MLGETFEYVDDSKQFRFVAEQVSHHPPIGTTHCETPNFIYYQTQNVKTKFLGNSLDVTPIGVTHIILKKWDEHYSIPNIKTVVHNIIIGTMWVDHFGKTLLSVVKNSTNEALPVQVDIKFKKCGWFGKGWRDVEGQVLVGSGNNAKAYFDISGKWNDTISATATQLGRNVSTSNLKNPINFSDGSAKVIWKNTSVPLSKDNKFSKYGWSEFTEHLNYIDDEMRKYLPVTDSRLREDRYFLEKGEIKNATKSKNILEEAQRARRKSLEESKEKYTPRYFDAIDTPEGVIYQFNEKYWKEREERRKFNEENNKLTTIDDANKFWRITSHKKWSEQ